MLEQSQQNWKKHISGSDNLRSQIKHLEKQLIRVNGVNASVLKENKSLKKTISDLKFSLTGLEAIRDQLEGDRYNLEIKLEKKGQGYCQVSTIAITF